MCPVNTPFRISNIVFLLTGTRPELAGRHARGNLMGGGDEVVVLITPIPVLRAQNDVISGGMTFLLMTFNAERKASAPRAVATR